MIDHCEKQINLFLYYAEQQAQGYDIDTMKHIDKKNIPHIKNFLDFCCQIIGTTDTKK